MRLKTLSAEDIKIIKRTLSYLKPFKKKYIITMVFTVTSLILALAQPLLFGQFLDGIIVKNTQSVFTTLLIMMIIYLLQAVISLGETYLTIDLSNSIICNIKDDLYKQMLYMPIKAFDQMQVKSKLLCNFLGLKYLKPSKHKHVNL